MDRNRILLLALCLTGLSFSAGCRASLTEIRSHWPADPIRFTDNRSMWLSQTVIHSFGKGLQVAMGNDERNAYLFFSPGKSDNEPINRMARLTVWFYRSGSKNREVGIRFTPSPLSLQGGTRFHPEGGSNSNPGQLGMPGLQEQVIIMDRKENREISVPNDGTKGILVRAYVEQDPCAYELSLSLSRGGGNSFGLDARPGETIGVEVEWNPIGFKEIRKSSEKKQEEWRTARPVSGYEGMPGPGIAILPMRRTIRFQTVLAPSRSS